MTLELNEISIIVSIVLSVLSFLLSAISVITVIITLKQNGKIIQVNRDQINEMRKEHEMSLQPIIDFMSPKFCVENPRLFFSPPEKEYSIKSRFGFQFEVNNISSAVVINFVCSVESISNTDEISLTLETCSERLNLLLASPKEMSFLLLEKEKGVVFDKLRERQINKLPQVEVTAVFKNAVGGAFRMTKRYIVCPGKDDLEIIKKWHSIISSANVDYMEELKKMRQGIDGDNVLFKQVKEKIEQRCGEKKELLIRCEELDDYFSYNPISIEDYNQTVKNAFFSHLVSYDG